MVALHVLCIDMTCIPNWLKFMADLSHEYTGVFTRVNSSS